MLRGILRFTFVLLLSFVLIARYGFPEILASEISSMELVELANADRAKQNLQPLKYNKKLERAAFDKADNMFKQQYWAHYGPNGESPWQFILGSGYSYSYAGENLAKGFADSASVHAAWMASPTHRANILDAQFQDVGIAVVKGKLQGADIFLVVQMFGTAAYAPTIPVDKTPSLKIKQPKDGDILEEGITDIRGDATNLEQPSVSLYVNKNYITSALVSSSQFSAQTNLSAAQGDQVLTVKATGTGTTPLSDSVVVTVVSQDGKQSLANCIKVTPGATNTTVTYSCTKQLTNFSVTVGSVRFTKNANNNTISIPVNSLPKDTSVSAVISATFSDNTTEATSRKLSEFVMGNTANAGTQSVLAGFSLFSIGLRTWVYIAFALAFLMLIAYGIELIIKKKLATHRYELFAYLLLLAILFIAFNFGYIRI